MPKRPYTFSEKPDTLVEQDTAILVPVHGEMVPLSRHKVLRRLPEPLQLPLLRLYRRARDPEPEAYYKNDPAPDGARRLSISLGWLPLLTLTSALGMFLVAYAFHVSRAGEAGWEVLFFTGLLLIYVPPLLRLISPAPSRFERVALVCLVGLLYYLIKVMASPLYFSMFDEFLHWCTVNDITASGHLFSANALLPVSPFYPGLEIVTSALASLSGLDTFTSGLIVIGFARLLMVLSLFALYEQLMGSSRMAGLAVMIYMANPHFLLFDAQYAYESLALPLALFVMFVMSPHQKISVCLERSQPMVPFMVLAKERYEGLRNDLRGLTCIAWAVLTALTFTHHVTDFFFVALLLLWAITYTYMRLIPLRRSNLAKTALFAVGIVVVCTIRAGNPVIGYLSSFIGVSLHELVGVFTGSGGARQLFVTYTGQPTPLWERLVTLSSVGLIVFCLPFGLLCLWQRYRSNALACTFFIVALFYPLSQLFRFTTTGAELTDRAAPFLFIAIAAVMSMCIVQFWPVRWLNWRQSLILTGAAALLFLGGVILGTGPSSALLPGPYEVIADVRSIEPEGIQAAIWMQAYLGPNNRVATDRINQILMGSYGNQRIVSTIADRIDISPVFFSLQLGPSEASLLKSVGVSYLVVDLRLARALPLLGFYYEQNEEGAYRHTVPISMQALTKFNGVPQVDRTFDSGDIVIYNVGGLINALEAP
jgi:hypothetical protein